jgi:glycosyltransferase involved in cell wall biosynthesis
LRIDSSITTGKSNNYIEKESKSKKVIVVMPAYNAEMTLKKTLEDIPGECVDEIILVDDGSTDQTADIARELGITVFIHEKNKGYGANQKTCYNMALQKKAEYIIMIHPDYQYDSRLIPVALEILKLNICDIILGCRIRTRKECLEGGMPVYKYISNRILTIIENVALGQNLGEFHSGFRAYKRAVLERIPFQNNSDGFTFDSQLLIQAIHSGFVIGDIPMPVRYFKEASSVNFWQGMVYGIKTLYTILILFMHKLGVLNSPLFSFKDKAS